LITLLVGASADGLQLLSKNNEWLNINAPANSAPLIASNASIFTNIEGNFVYLRAKVKDFDHGIVNFVKLSY
jgi:isopenicillin N synthase-like dioxygenase